MLKIDLVGLSFVAVIVGFLVLKTAIIGMIMIEVFNSDQEEHEPPISETTFLTQAPPQERTLRLYAL